MVIGIDCSRAFGEEKTGTENYSYQVIKHLLRLSASPKTASRGGPEVREHRLVLFTRPKAILPDWTRQKGVEIKRIKYRYLWTQVGLTKATWQKFRIQNSDFRFLDVLWVPAHTLPVLRRPGLKTVVTIHGLEYRWLPEYRNIIQRWYLPLSTIYAVKRTDKLIAVSKFTKDELVGGLGVSSERIEVVYEGVEQEAPGTRRRADLARWGIRGQYLLFVGTLSPRKNLESLIRAYAKVKAKYPDLQLVIAGGKGWMTEELFRTPGREGVQEGVVFTGRVSEKELASLYSQAMIYVQPSVTEGFGLPVLEAMAAGVPVVSSDGGALAEVVGSAGTIVPLRRKIKDERLKTKDERRKRKDERGGSFEERLAGAMERVLGDAVKRGRMVKAGRARVRAWGWEKTAEKVWKVLSEWEN